MIFLEDLCGHYHHQLQISTIVYFAGTNLRGTSQAESQCILFIHCAWVSKPNFKLLWNQICFPGFLMEQGSVRRWRCSKGGGGEKVREDEAHLKLLCQFSDFPDEKLYSTMYCIATWIILVWKQVKNNIKIQASSMS